MTNNEGLSLKNIKADLNIRRPIDWVGVIAGVLILAAGFYAIIGGIIVIGMALGGR